jgi:hypothetical protein
MAIEIHGKRSQCELNSVNNLILELQSVELVGNKFPFFKPPSQLHVVGLHLQIIIANLIFFQNLNFFSSFILMSLSIILMLNKSYSVYFNLSHTLHTYTCHVLSL